MTSFIHRNSRIAAGFIFIQLLAVLWYYAISVDAGSDWVSLHVFMWGINTMFAAVVALVTFMLWFGGEL